MKRGGKKFTIFLRDRHSQIRSFYMENQQDSANIERFKEYRTAFDGVWKECAKGHTNDSVESTVEGPLKMADALVGDYFKGL